MRYRALGNTGLQVSALGFGAAPLGDEYGTADVAECVRAVHFAIDHGINFFDVSPYYGRTLAESRLGEAIHGKRDKLVLATKVGRYGLKDFDFSAAKVKAGLDESLRRLRTDHVDLVQAHDIDFGDELQIVEETIPAMRDIQKAGKARFIGVTGYPLKLLRRVAEAGAVDTVLSYCRYDLLVTDMDVLLTPYLEARGIGLINASPFHMGILTDVGPPAWHMAAREVLETGVRLSELCRSRGVTISDIALRFCTEHPYAATTVAGMAHESHVKSNLLAMERETDPELMRELMAIIEPVKDASWPWGRPEYDDYESYRFVCGRRD